MSLASNSAVGLAELCDPASKVESVALLLVCVTTVIVVFLLLKDLVCWFPREACFVSEDLIGKDCFEVCEIMPRPPAKDFHCALICA